MASLLDLLANQAGESLQTGEAVSSDLLELVQDLVKAINRMFSLRRESLTELGEAFYFEWLFQSAEDAKVSGKVN